LGDTSQVLIVNEPTTWELYNRIVENYTKWRKVPPAGHGYYVPSLEEAERLLTLNDSSSCALALCFMSDGRPSDQGGGTTRILEKMESLSMRFGRRLSFSAIGIGSDDNEFAALQQMVEVAKDFGVQASFVLPSMTTSGLGLSITATATSLTRTQTEMTDMVTLKQKCVRNVIR